MKPLKVAGEVGDRLLKSDLARLGVPVAARPRRPRPRTARRERSPPTARPGPPEFVRMPSFPAPFLSLSLAQSASRGQSSPANLRRFAAVTATSYRILTFCKPQRRPRAALATRRGSAARIDRALTATGLLIGHALDRRTDSGVHGLGLSRRRDRSGKSDSADRRRDSRALRIGARRAARRLRRPRSRTSTARGKRAAKRRPARPRSNARSSRASSTRTGPTSPWSSSR